MATKVKLRTKAISDHRHSLYLDFYPAIVHPDTGLLTRREFLGRYLFDKPKSPVQKQHNVETQQTAEHIRQKRDNQINKPEIYTGYEKEQLKIKEKLENDFIKYFRKLADKRKGSNYDNWTSAQKYLEAFSGGRLKFADLSETFLHEFRDHLLTTKSNNSDKVTLAQNSAVSYFNKVKAAVKQGFKDGYLQVDLNSRVPSIKPAETKRSFLTMEELNRLVKTECHEPLLKKAALISALTGLRFSDVQKLTWSEVEHIKGQGYFIQFKQQKTKGVEVLPISEQAVSLFGERGGEKDKILPGLQYSAYQNKHLHKWIEAAGITKDITFHCFRHTYATLQLSKGTDIYTVSKMLGHRELKTTQVYAKIIDQSKRDAAGKITLDFGD